MDGNTETFLAFLLRRRDPTAPALLLLLLTLLHIDDALLS